jgi:hypothetical protein
VTARYDNTQYTWDAWIIMMEQQTLGVRHGCWAWAKLGSRSRGSKLVAFLTSKGCVDRGVNPGLAVENGGEGHGTY